VTPVTALWRNWPYSYTTRKEGFAMRHILSVIVVATLLVATAVEVIAGWTKMDASRNNHYAAPMTGISIALPSGMKSFPVELPQ
jgi:TRAP-type C4-dicarboxylate transport system permease small subunit